MKFLIAAPLLLASLAAHATTNEYSVLPVIGSEMYSADGKTYTYEVIDTQYKRGTVVIDLPSGNFQSHVGGRVVNGRIEASSEDAELPAVYGVADVTLWNQERSGGGGDYEQFGHENARSRNGSEVEPLWRRAIFDRLRRMCQANQQQAIAAVAAAAATCVASGGQHSGGHTGYGCGIGASTGTCTRPPVAK